MHTCEYTMHIALDTSTAEEAEQPKTSVETHTAKKIS